MILKKIFFFKSPGNFAGGPEVKTLPPTHGVWVWFLVGELRSHMTCGQKTKSWNRNSTVTTSIKTLKMVHVKKKKIWKKVSRSQSPYVKYVCRPLCAPWGLHQLPSLKSLSHSASLGPFLSPTHQACSLLIFSVHHSLPWSALPLGRPGLLGTFNAENVSGKLGWVGHCQLDLHPHFI